MDWLSRTRWSEIVLQSLTELRYPAAVESPDRFQQGLGRMFQRHEFLLDAIKRLDTRPLGLYCEDSFLDSFQLRGDRIKHRKVAVDDSIHQSIENIGGTVAQQFRLLFTAFAHLDKSLFRPLAHRQNVITSDKDADLADAELIATILDHVQHDKKRLAVLLDFWALMAFMSVFDGKVVQAEFRLHQFQFGGLGIFQRHPNEAIGPADKQMNLLDRYIGELLAVLVSGAVDEQPITPSIQMLCAET
jgi:hypothetical protein